MPAVAGIGVAAGLAKLGVFAAQSVAYYLTATVVEGALTYGLYQIYQKYWTDKDEDPDRTNTINPNELQFRQDIPTRRIVFGTPVVEGAPIFVDTSNEKGRLHPDVVNTGDAGVWKVIQLALAAHPTDGVEWIEVGGERLILAPIGYFAPTGETFGAAVNDRFAWRDSDGDLRRYLAVSMRHGGEYQASDRLQNLFFPGSIHNLHIGQTIYTGAQHFGFNAEEHTQLWGEGDRVRVKLRGAKVYDPRDALQDPDDPETWKHTRNAALNFNYMLTNPLFINGLTQDMINLDSLRRAADICEDARPTMDGGTEQQYTADGVVSCDETQQDVIEQFRLSMFGNFIYDGRQWHITAGTPEDPIGTITDRMIAGDIIDDIGVPPADHVTRLSVRNVLAEANYRVATQPIIEFGDQEPRNERPLFLRFTQGISRGQRIGQMHLRNAMNRRVVRVPLTNEIEQYLPGAILVFDSQRFPMHNGIYKLERMNPNEEMNMYEVELERYDRGIFNFDPGTIKPFDIRTVAGL